MKLLVIVLGIVVLNQASAMRLWGWLSDDYNTDEVVVAEEDPTDECRQLARWGQCAFYDCVEDRFPCRREGYTERVSKHFCNKVDTNYDLFDDFGQRWLNQTSVCLQSYLLTIYEQSETTCADIKAAGIESIINCNEGVLEGRTFCDFLDTNGDAYNSLMGRDEIMLMASLRDYRVFSSMVTQAVQCGVGSMSETLSSVGSSVGNFFSSISGWFYDR